MQNVVLLTLPTGLGKESILQPMSRHELPRTEQKNTGTDKYGKNIKAFYFLKIKNKI